MHGYRSSLTLKYSPSIPLSLLTLFQSLCRVIEFSGTGGNLTTPIPLGSLWIIVESAFFGTSFVVNGFGAVDTMLIFVLGCRWFVELSGEFNASVSTRLDWKWDDSMVWVCFGWLHTVSVTWAGFEFVISEISGLILGAFSFVSLECWELVGSAAMWRVVVGGTVMSDCSSPISSIVIRFSCFWGGENG